MNNRTPLFDWHMKAEAQMVNFAGWDMPLHYGSQIQEHHQVRNRAGIFDVSHMGVVDIEGQEARTFLRHLLANDVAKLKLPGQALYTCLLNDEGGVLDDLIVFKINENSYRLIINAGCRDKDLQWLKKYSSYQVTVTLQPLCIIALQGPQAISIAEEIFPADISPLISALNPFNSIVRNDLHISRTGYTGEDGLEIITTAEQALLFWQSCVEKEVAPCGLASRDTLRLEAGLNLYGADMDETTSPLESNLAWTIDWSDPNRDFIGRRALTELKKKGLKQQLVGLSLLPGEGLLRHGQKVLIDNENVGAITSGTFSPTLNYAIGLARVPVTVNLGDKVMIERRRQLLPATVVKLPFVKKKKSEKIFI